jgi:hypothetical protein
LWVDDSHVLSGPAGLRLDVVRGELGTLRSTGGDFAAALNAVPIGDRGVCLVMSALVTEFAETIVPNPGEGFFIVVRAIATCHDKGSYDGTDAKQVGFRDAEIKAAANTCP